MSTPKARKVMARLVFPNAMHGDMPVKLWRTDKGEWRIPATPEAYERMLAQATVALEQADSCDHREDVCIVLHSLGIHPPAVAPSTANNNKGRKK